MRRSAGFFGRKRRTLLHSGRRNDAGRVEKPWKEKPEIRFLWLYRPKKPTVSGRRPIATCPGLSSAKRAKLSRAWLRIQMDDGTSQVFTVISTDGDVVNLDGNHPLAGMNLKFDLKICSVRAATAEELDHGHPHCGGDGCGTCHH